MWNQNHLHCTVVELLNLQQMLLRLLPLSQIQNFTMVFWGAINEGHVVGCLLLPLICLYISSHEYQLAYSPGQHCEYQAPSLFSRRRSIKHSEIEPTANNTPELKRPCQAS
ncbi:hypothetical protein SAY87_010614 [Trapa incisa]|uniref:Uncharacterized protein n=1 Tax=Trapa incisa TaxID=236973 RepID=A0AAN7GQP5_9MYRT|nr:hypothetical protein SAY87_010614 [Trapa incisa]